MHVTRSLARAARRLGLGALAALATGCGITPSDSWISPRPAELHPARMEIRESMPARLKPSDAVKEVDEDSPARWRQKLKAKYA